MPDEARPAARETIRLRINGTAQVLEVMPRETLADVLRDRLGLTGTHLGCEQGSCGACTVEVDGRPARSCLLFAVQVVGREVTTIEGVPEERRRALAEAMSRHGGLQCGFCTPGFMMLALATYGGPCPNADIPVEETASSNICRCGCYQGIRDAFREVYGPGSGTGRQRTVGPSRT